MKSVSEHNKTAFTVYEGSFYLIWFFDQIDQNGVVQISVDFWC